MPARRPLLINYIIHIGPHKTGTTYLQHAFTELRPWLEPRGICYPEIWGSQHGHHLLTDRLAQNDDAAMQAEFDALAVSGEFDTILLSSETFAYWDEGRVRRLKALLRDAPVMVVFYFRRWSELLPSHWREVVKHGTLETLPEFALKRMADPEAAEVMNAALVLERYARVFGADSLRVASYNAIVESGEDLLVHFSRSFLNWADPPANEIGRINVSLDMVDSEILRALNALEWLRARDTRLRLFHRYMALKDSLPIRWIVDQSMQFTVNRIRIDDGARHLADLHDRIAHQYRYALVTPCPGGRLFAPKVEDVAYIQADYLLAPGIMEALCDIHAKLLAAERIG
jgi:hypothetical protein